MTDTKPAKPVVDKQEATTRGLQSRKAKRSNEIAALERAIILHKGARKIARSMHFISAVKDISHTIYDIRQDVKKLANDQRLDGTLLRTLHTARRANWVIVA